MARDVPKIEVKVNGKPVHAVFYEKLIEARMHDAKGFDSDTFEATFDDDGYEIEEPEEGAIIEVAIGYEGEGLFKRGVYKVDKPPKQSGGVEKGEFLTIFARAADMSGDLKEKASEHYEDTTLGEVFDTIGGRHGLAVNVSPGLRAIPVPYLARFNQSTLAFGTELAKRYGGAFTIKNRTLIFAEEGKGSASGLMLPRLKIDKSDCAEWDFEVESRPRHRSVKAPWFDRAAGRTRFEEVSTGLQKGPVKVLRHPYPDASAAERAAKAEGRRLAKATASGSITLEDGLPEACAECEIDLSGFRPSACGLWIAESVDDVYGDKYTTEIKLEAPEGGRG